MPKCEISLLNLVGSNDMYKLKKKKKKYLKWSKTNTLEVNNHQMEMEFTLNSRPQWTYEN